MPVLGWEDFEVAFRDLAGIFKVVGFIMLVPLAITVYYAESYGLWHILARSLAFIVPSTVLFVLYFLFKTLFVTEKKTETKHALLAVVFIWMFIALVGSLPFLIRGTLGPVDGFFESMSGWATTGMTMIEYPEETDRDILFYRSLTHEVGGVGIIALGLMVLMHSGTAAIAYYSSEVGDQKIKPGIRSTVIETWKIYLFYTVAGIVLLSFAGMTPFDAVNHAFAAIATGGFSTHSESIAYYDSVWVELVCILLMLAGATSFLVHFKLFNGQIRAFTGNIESKYMFGLILGASIIISLLFLSSETISGVDTTSVFDVVRRSVFQVVSSITCTGFSTVNAGEWPPLAQTILMILMYTGGFYGSTAGGIKLLRLAVVVGAIFHTVRRMLLPRTAVVTMKVAGKPIENEEILYVLALSTIYLMVALVGAAIIMALGYEALDSISLSLSAMGNVGIVYITGSPWFNMPAVGKIVVALLMWIGRLEIFPILMLLASMHKSIVK